MKRLALLSAMAWLAVAGSGCGSSGGAADGGAGSSGGGGHAGAGGQGGGDAGMPSGSFKWQENGMQRSSPSTLANRYVAPSSDTLTVVGFDPAANVTLSFVVSSDTALDGTYACGVPADGGLGLASVTYNNLAPKSSGCTITVAFTTTAAGQSRVTGTIDAMVVYGDLSTAITDGTFDLPVMTTRQ